MRKKFSNLHFDELMHFFILNENGHCDFTESILSVFLVKVLEEANVVLVALLYDRVMLLFATLKVDVRVDLVSSLRRGSVWAYTNKSLLFIL